MEKYIPKATLVAKIERMIKHYNESAKEFGDEGYNDNVLMEQCKANACKHILSLIDTFEVKEVDLDFTKEVDVWVRDNGDTNGFFNVQELAKHFFELGLKAQKGE